MKDKIAPILSFILATIVGLIVNEVVESLTSPLSLFFAVLFACLYIQLFFKKKKEIDKLKNLITDYEKRENQSAKRDEGEQLFYMALTQNVTNPYRYNILNRSVYEFKNPLAALLLGSCYEFGDHKELDMEKAADIFEQCLGTDSTGAVLWQLAWLYESNGIEKARKMSEKDRLAYAFELYKRSANQIGRASCRERV